MSSRFPAAVLPALLEASVPVCPDDAIVQPCAVNEAHGVLRVSPCVISDTTAAKVCVTHTHTLNLNLLKQSGKHILGVETSFLSPFGTLKSERILYKTESTGRLLDLIQTYDDALHIATFRKQLMHLFSQHKSKINRPEMF